jgi:hypothetical protein
MMHHSRRFIQIPTNIYTVLERRHNGAKEIREEKGCNKKRRWKGEKKNQIYHIGNHMGVSLETET